MTLRRRAAASALALSLSLTLALAVSGALTVGTSATAATSTTPSYAHLGKAGPRLRVPAADLRASLECHGNPAAKRQPVLLNPATSVTPEQNYSWSYEPAFTAQHRYWCAVTMPFHTYGDIQVAGEHLVHAIRTMHRRTGRRIAVLGHSQGGMSMRWALRFWPDTRAMVDDVIGMAPSNHGTTAITGCIKGLTTCTPAVWQQQKDSRFMKALNSRAETFRGISYTVIYTHTDEVVTPNGSAATSSSALRTGRGRITNVATQDVCPTDVYEHLTVGTIDPTTYALVMDALTHRGPADPARIGTSSCGQLYMPYVDPTSVDTYLQPLQALLGLASTPLPLVNLTGAPMVRAEPKLRCYVYAGGC
ncbi:lipase [Nocardioides sp. JQ2195]|uniref:esterase/lipase family protein n=1 Tax=Nocardioides sp. JQ2195 TaxID=2592334 RepID=UPI00143EABD5|nr:lipase [Nocardioides sp. JQ2195]QIX28471.1 lipase [Nocardioides sp. JQ2195]